MKGLLGNSHWILAALLVSSAVAHAQQPQASQPVALPPAPQQTLGMNLPLGLSMDWGMALGGTSISSEVQQEQVVEYENLVLLDYENHEYWHFHSGIFLQFQVGRTEYFDDADTDESSLRLREAYAELGPNSVLFSEAGAIYTRSVFSDLLVGERAFPMVTAGVRLMNSEKAQLRLFGLRAVPTSSTLSSEANSTEGLPTLDALAISGEVRPTPYLKFEGKGSLYAFNNIPTQIIAESEFGGNRVNSYGSTNAELLYPYQGLDFALGVKWDTTPRFLTELAYQYTANQNAPSERGRAYTTGARGSYLFQPNLRLAAATSYYEVAQDATIAYYGGGFLKHTNIQGYRIDFDVEFPESDMRLRTSFYRAQPLYEDYFLEPVTAVKIALEMFNELI